MDHGSEVPWAPSNHLLAPDGRSLGPLAPVTLRVIAQILNWVIWLALSTAASLLLFGAVDDAQDVSIWLLATIWLAPRLVDTLLISSRGWDPGKFLLRLRVIDAHGSSPDLARSAIRTLVLQAPLVLAWIPGFVGGLAAWLYLPWLAVLIATIATNADRQGLHDRAARTFVVVRTGPGERPDRAARPVP